MNSQNYLRSTPSERRKSVMGNGSCPLTEHDSWKWTLAAFEGKITNLLHYWLMFFFSLIPCIIYLGITVLHYVQSTPDNSNPQGKLKKMTSSYRKFKLSGFRSKKPGIRKIRFSNNHINLWWWQGRQLTLWMGKKFNASTMHPSLQGQQETWFLKK